ncbi:MAG: winged helix-turn-helix transcriptional regulator [Planctomycetota bacterium]|jgi:DNA-binding transcriptional regulator LsrR (DeoR family)|nr:winged helix-turn-helix transcriptional regulator [Planctomycetota bacterium]
MFNLNSDNSELLRRVAWLYHEEGLNQQDIADRLRLSRTKVLRVLKECRDTGLVKVSLDVATGVLFGMEERMREVFGLDECLVTPAAGEPMQSVAKALAYRFEEALRTCSSIGLGGGRTLHAFAQRFDPPENMCTREVIILVGNTKANYAIEPYEIVSILASKLAVDVYNVWAPAKVNNAKEAELIKSVPSISKVLKMGEKVDVAFLGIGDMAKSSYIRYGYLSEEKVASYVRAGAIGEVLGRFFTIDGEIIEKNFNQLFISVPMPLKSKAIGFAGGIEKVSAILGALRTGWLSGLITDEFTAAALLEAARNGK